MVTYGKLRMRHGQTLLIFTLLLIQALQLLHHFIHPAHCPEQQASRTAIARAHSFELEETPPPSSWLVRLYGVIGGDTSWRRQAPAVVYVVTATYSRVTQLADLTRLAQTLMNLDFVYWVVVEDSETRSSSVAALLERSGLPHHHSAAPTPPEYRHTTSLGRGVFNRRAALEWLREEGRAGVLYFADDDNTYDVRLFQQMRSTKRVSVFPVGMILHYGISSPIVRDHRVVGFHDAFQAGRLFALDMAGFAVNLDLVHSYPSATLPARVSYLEDGFLRALNVSLEELEPLAEDCTQVLVWHTRTEPAYRANKKNLPLDHQDSNLDALYSTLLD